MLLVPRLWSPSLRVKQEALAHRGGASSQGDEGYRQFTGTTEMVTRRLQQDTHLECQIRKLNSGRFPNMQIKVICNRNMEQLLATLFILDNFNKPDSSVVIGLASTVKRSWVPILRQPHILLWYVGSVPTPDSIRHWDLVNDALIKFSGWRLMDVARTCTIQSVSHKPLTALRCKGLYI